jgi:hypothetical protein
MKHREIRFNILHNLYQKHYSDQLGHPQLTDTIIQESGLGNLDKNVVYGDIVYLVESGLATGDYVLGRASPFTIQITTHGIDTVENIVDNLFENVGSEDISSEVKTDMKQISTESSPNVRIRKVWEFKTHPDFVLNVFDKVLKPYLGTVS